jgi:hypothetical protein
MVDKNKNVTKYHINYSIIIIILSGFPYSGHSSPSPTRETHPFISKKYTKKYTK